MKRLLAIPIAMLLMTPALAHEALPTAAQPEGWRYGTECCSKRDCYQLEKDQVKPVKDGWYVSGKGIVAVTIPYNDPKIRESQDGMFHACVPYPSLVRCLYVPPFGL